MPAYVVSLGFRPARADDESAFKTPVFHTLGMEILFWITAFLSAVLGTLAAFGISSMLLPVALNTFTYETAIVLVSLFHISTNLGRIGFFKSGVDTKLMGYFGGPAVVFTFLGASLIGYLNVGSLKALVGGVLILYSGLNLLDHKLKFSPTKGNSIIGGSVYGFLSGLVGTGGPIRGAILTGFGLKREQYISTSGAISFFIDLTRISVYLQRGFLQPDYYWYLPFLLIVALVGAYTSKRIVELVSSSRFVKLVQAAILILSIKLVVDGLSLA